MKKAIKNLFLGLIPGAVKNAILHPEKMRQEQTWKAHTEYAQISFSQEGEDILLNRIFNFRPHGTYVDIGAHHPRRFSNTYFFYRLGWTGINIDAAPDSMKAFESERSKDINLEVGIGLEPGKLQFHIFKEPALSTFDKELAAKNAEESNIARL